VWDECPRIIAGKAHLISTHVSAILLHFGKVGLEEWEGLSKEGPWHYVYRCFPRTGGEDLILVNTCRRTANEPYNSLSRGWRLPGRITNISWKGPLSYVHSHLLSIASVYLHPIDACSMRYCVGNVLLSEPETCKELKGYIRFCTQRYHVKKTAAHVVDIDDRITL